MNTIKLLNLKTNNYLSDISRLRLSQQQIKGGRQKSDRAIVTSSTTINLNGFGKNTVIHGNGNFIGII
jgi:hypothetical protein